MDRFDGKKVIIRQVSDGISKADELVDLALSGNVPVYHAAEGAKTEVKIFRRRHRPSDLCTADEWCFTYAAICYRRRYPDRHCISDRWSFN